MAALPSLDTRYPALIFKASRGTIHHGAVGITRSLGRLGVPVYAIVEDSYTPLATSRYLTKAIVWKSWPREREAFLGAMSEIGEIINHPAILVPMDDLSAVLVAENASALSRYYLCPQLPWDLPRQMANKASFHSLCVNSGIPCPRSVVPHSIDDVREFIEQTTFPVVVKAVEQWRLINDRYSAQVIHTPEALFEFCENIKFEGSQMVLQEYIPGEDWIYHGYSNAKMSLHVGFTGKKLLGYPAGSGATAIGVSILNEELRSQSELLMQTISYSGIIDIDWRRDEGSGQYKIVDCNPRVGMNFRMFEDGAGIDVVRAQHLNLSGRNIERSKMVEGRRFIVEPYYLLSSIRSGWSVLTTEADPLPKGDKELAWWSSDDKLPFLVMSARLLPQTIMRALLTGLNHLIRALLPKVKGASTWRP